MKKVLYVVLGLGLLLLAAVGFLESPWGKQVALQLLTRSLRESGFVIQVGTIQGSLPQKIELSDVDIRGKGVTIQANTLSFELSLIRLLKRELYIQELNGTNISYTLNSAKNTSSLPFEQQLPLSLKIQHFHFTGEEIGELSGKFRLRRNGRIQLQLDWHQDETTLALSALGTLSGPLHGEVKGKWKSISYAGAFTWSAPWNGRFEGLIKEIPHVSPLAVRIDLFPAEEGWKINGKYQTSHWAFGAFPIEQVSGEGEALWKEGTWEGSVAIKGNLYQQSWQGKGDFSWTIGDKLQLDCWTVEGPTTLARGSWVIRNDGLIEGSGNLQVEKLQAWALPFLPLFGSANGSITWQVNAGEQKIYLEGEAHRLFWKEWFAEKAIGYGEWGQGGQIDVFQGKWKELDFTALHVETNQRDFRASVEGKWKHPFELQLGGSWEYESPEWQIELLYANGSFYEHPFSLQAPLRIEKSTSLLHVTPLELRLGDGNLRGFFSHEDDQTRATLAIRHLPIDMLSLNPLDLTIAGFFDLDADLVEQNHTLSAKLEATFDQLQLVSLEEQTPSLPSSGRIEAQIERERLIAQGALSHLLQFHLNLPLHVEIWPFSCTILETRELGGALSFHGNLEEIFDFFDWGTHQFTGEAHCDLTLSHSWSQPRVSGTCLWKNGTYQNYYTGTQLENIQAEWIGEGNQLLLRSLTAQDYQQKGILQAEGAILLQPTQHFPFHFDLSFEHLNCIEVDLITAEANGHLDIIGNLEKATATGHISILQSQFLIPEHIPRPVPKLQVVYRNPIYPTEPLPKEPPTPYPLFLQLQVSAPEGIFIGGRGLTSEWKGNFDVEGTLTSPAAKGKLELLQGEFLFASRRFRLSEGSLSLSGKEHEMPHLNIAASMEQNDVLITARLKGPLNQPQLTFQSTPPLPISSILAYLLFGEDLSEINGVQALQLANAIATLSGEGPDVLETTRRTLGVDRLRIITVPSGAEEGEDAIALQVGKYVAKGVIISISQGTEDSSSNISIEVELKYGFIFQAETQQQQEQGKFTLKWNHNY